MRGVICCYLKKNLCPTDFSEPSYKALKAASDLAKEFSAELILIHVLSPMQVFPTSPGFTPGQPAASGYIPEQIIGEAQNQAAESLDKALEERVPKELKSRSILLQGNPAEEIAGYTEKEKVSVIIIGTHGYSGWRHLLLGSVTEKVVRSSSIPVLTIPADQE